MEKYILQSLFIYSIFTCLIIIKFHSTSMIQAIARLMSKKFRHPDDAKFFGKGRGTTDGGLSPLDQTAQRIWQNDIENIYPFLFVALIFSLSSPGVFIQITYFSLYFSTRILHSIFLIFPKQPYRNIFYQGGNVLTVVTIIHAVYNLYGLLNLN
jgi:uncharacterized MAPEG superfamily protein